MSGHTHVKVLSWNLDGLDEDELELRTLSVCDVINAELPHACLLQEVVDQTLTILKNLCDSYIFKCMPVCNYFTVILIKKDEDLDSNQFKCENFPNSEMGRNVIYQQVKLHSEYITFMTTHLESLKDRAEERKRQLTTCFNLIRDMDNKHTVIFSGDLNIREPEIRQLGGCPPPLFDAWEAVGSAENRFTWDLKLNDNKKFDNNFQPRARFDRMYCKSGVNKDLTCSSFQLVGKERIEACGRYPSDHFGILARFDITAR